MSHALFSSVPESCQTLQPHGLQHARVSVHHQLRELAQTHVHQGSDAIQPSHPLLPPSPPPSNIYLVLYLLNLIAFVDLLIKHLDVYL